jgi:hypothetical protein
MRGEVRKKIEEGPGRRGRGEARKKKIEEEPGRRR